MNILKYITIFFLTLNFAVGGVFASGAVSVGTNKSVKTQEKKTEKTKLKLSGQSIKNGFFVFPKKFNFDKSIRSGKCYGTLPYPHLENQDEELFGKINEEIHDFVEIYAICNKGERDEFSVRYEIPNSNSAEHFSVLWKTYKDKKLWRIDALTFSNEDGEMLKIEEVFNDMSMHLMRKLVNLSEGHLYSNAKWDMFIEKYHNRDIQFYLKEKKWYLIFNSTSNNENIVHVELPKYFSKAKIFKGQ
jgi:hypothetical protein